MRVVWARHPLTANEVVAALTEHDPTWHPKTARTLLARLVQKGVLGYRATERPHRYTARFTEAECVAAASDSFLNRVFAGALKPMLAHFVERQALSAEELRDLQALLAKKQGPEAPPNTGRRKS